MHPSIDSIVYSFCLSLIYEKKPLYMNINCLKVLMYLPLTFYHDMKLDALAEEFYIDL